MLSFSNMLLLRSIYAFLPTGISTAIDVKYETCFSISMDCRDQCPEHVIPSSSMGKKKNLHDRASYLPATVCTLFTESMILY